MNNKLNTSHGFTLIELLVVIAIIVLLVSILVPSVKKALFLAKTTVCAANMRGINMGAATYAVDNNNFYPTNTIDTAASSRTAWYPLFEHMGISATNAVELKNYPGWHCPIAATADRNSELNKMNPGWAYGFNIALTFDSRTNADPNNRQVPVTLVYDASKCGLGLEAGWRQTPLHSGELAECLFDRGDIYGAPKMGPVHDGKSANIVFADGHVELQPHFEGDDLYQSRYNPDYVWTHKKFWGVEECYQWRQAAN